MPKSTKRTESIAVRMTEDERRRLDAVAAAYRLETSVFLRLAVAFIDETRPNLLMPMATPETMLAG